MALDRILVTGGTGFIGKHLCVHARSQGMAVTALSLNPPSERIGDVRYLQADQADEKAMAEALHGLQFDYVVNCAGYVDHSPFWTGGSKVSKSHLLGLMNLLEVVDRQTLLRFIHIGSSDEYGNATAPQQEDVREQPISGYSWAKTAGTHLLQTLWRTEGFPCVILRVFLTYGPGQSTNRFIPQVITGCLSKKAFPVSEGTQLRDFSYVSDIVEGIMKALVADNICGEVINLASGQPVSIRFVIESIRDNIGYGCPEFGRIPFRAGENMQVFADIEKARRLLDWIPQVGLDEGLKYCIERFSK